MVSRLIAAGLAIGWAGAFVQAQTPALPAIKSVPPSVPYRWKNVVIRAGGFITGILFSPAQEGLIYVRTDVGGAYRSDDDGAHWIPLTDQFGPENSTYTGIESIAPDPSDPRKVYIAAGLYTAAWGGPSAIFRSSDKGKTLEMTPMPFKMGGNDDGRGAGERLAVDPNLGSILFFGSRLAGLWKSIDSGVTWLPVDSFPAPAKLTGPGNRTGITFVAFDPSSSTKGSATKTMYVGVAQAGIGLYRSQDGGTTWELLPGAPKDLFPNHAVLDPGNTLYLSYDDNIGPNGIQDGAIWKYTLRDGKWKNITPETPGLGESPRKFGYGGLAIDAQHPDTLMVTTIDRWYPSDQIFRTTNGGRKWTEVGPDAMYSAVNAPWVYWHKNSTGGTGWMNGISIDPFHPGIVLYTTGEGIWGTDDITNADSGKPTHWNFPNEGLEETVALQLVSPPQGVHLLSAVGDIGGFRHDDMDTSPAGGFFINPQLNTTTGIDFAALNPNIIVRVGYGDARTVRGGYSLDDGLTWQPFASEPPSSHNGAGRIALSADGKIVVWSPVKGVPFWTTNWGKTWSPCNGLDDRMSVVSDRVNPEKFYSFHVETGQLLESWDGAQVFKERAAPVAARGEFAVMAPTPGIEGDLWISAGNKLYHSTDSGATFATLDGMEKVYNVGFGMSAAGLPASTVYVDGSALRTEGVFRSNDQGIHWVRIDDSEHQFGRKNSVIGDPRIYGRIYVATGGRGILYGDPLSPDAIGMPPAPATQTPIAQGH
jgi:photosystem II stability/assembly factor-like uncharacterized protein